MLVTSGFLETRLIKVSVEMSLKDRRSNGRQSEVSSRSTPTLTEVFGPFGDFPRPFPLAILIQMDALRLWAPSECRFRAFNRAKGILKARKPRNLALKTRFFANFAGLFNRLLLAVLLRFWPKCVFWLNSFRESTVAAEMESLYRVLAVFGSLFLSARELRGRPSRADATGCSGRRENSSRAFPPLMPTSYS